MVLTLNAYTNHYSVTHYLSCMKNLTRRSEALPQSRPKGRCRTLGPCLVDCNGSWIIFVGCFIPMFWFLQSGATLHHKWNHQFKWRRMNLLPLKNQSANQTVPKSSAFGSFPTVGNFVWGHKVSRRQKCVPNKIQIKNRKQLNKNKSWAERKTT